MPTESLFTEESWLVERTASIHEVEMDNGAIKFRVQVRDGNRAPFISRWFNDPVPAADFVEKMKTGFDPRSDRQ